MLRRRRPTRAGLLLSRWARPGGAGLAAHAGVLDRLARPGCTGLLRRPSGAALLRGPIRLRLGPALR
ncbi:hypothetical protein [Micromonospora sp. NPDC003776]